MGCVGGGGGTGGGEAKRSFPLPLLERWRDKEDLRNAAGSAALLMT